MRMRRGAAALALLCLAGIAGGCTSKPAPATGQPTPPPRSSASTAPADGGKYETVDSLLAALEAAGLPCVAPRSPAASAPGSEKVTCSPPAGEVSALVGVYSDLEVLADELGAFAGAAQGAPLSMLVGGNWSVVGPDAYVAQVHGKLGGSLHAS